MFPLSSLHFLGSAETSFPSVCKRGECGAFGPLPPTISLCHFSFLHPSLGIFPTTRPNHKIPAPFPTSQRLPEAARCTHAVLSCTLVSSHLSQMLALPPSLVASLLAMGFAGVSTGLTATSSVRGAACRAHLRVHPVLPSSLLKIKPCWRLGWEAAGRGHGDIEVPGSSLLATSRRTLLPTICIFPTC